MSDPTGARVPKQARSLRTLEPRFPLGAADSAFPDPGLLQLLLPLETNISCYYACLCPARLSAFAQRDSPLTFPTVFISSAL